MFNSRPNVRPYASKHVQGRPKVKGVLRLNAAIYLTWAAKCLQFSKAKTQENF